MNITRAKINSNTNKRTGKIIFLLFFLFCFISQSFANHLLLSSPPPDTTKKSNVRYPLESENSYPFSTSGNVSPLMLQPSNVEQKVVYDPETNSYMFNEKIGDVDYRSPSMMDFDEYNKYQNSQFKSEYWEQKSKEESGAGPSFLSGLRIGVEPINKVFGDEGIKITPQGSAELRFGYAITNNENPIIPVNNQRNGSFIFKEKIMMNVTGSIGDKMEVGLNYNTEATFDFENKTKLEYSGKEDEIIKKVEAGDVTFSLPGSLITGSQSLFGIKTELQFGKLRVSTVVSHQKSESSSINVQGGAQETEFEIDIDQYDVNRHFFLTHFFRDNYDSWMENLPYIESQLQIEEIEVWVVNKQNNFEESRDIVAAMDIGEGIGPGNIYNIQSQGTTFINSQTANQPAENNLNSLFGDLSQYSAIRSLSTVDVVFANISDGNYTFSRGRDYVSLENARLLTTREYSVNRELGYISLNSPMRNDEILAVAFTFTYKGKKYTVGELSKYVDAPGALIVKLLKGTTQTPKYKNWDLMMKNIYSIGAYQVNSEGFILDILYRNDKTGVATNYFTEEESLHSGVKNKTLLTILRLDNLDSRNEAIPDGNGFFDFIEGITINSRNGRIIFPVVEPFGQHLYDTLVNTPLGESSRPEYQRLAENYAFKELYDSTQTKAQQLAEKNKFFLRGRYRSSSSSDIMLNAMNIPRGSVIVMAGGRELTENVDYTVDYTLGRVKIINPGLAESGTPIQVKLESNSLFNLQTKTLLGTHLDYQFSENFNVGGTLMRLTERPLTQKVNIGEEPISNTIWGLNTSYRTESQILTSMVDKLPFIETKEVSSIAFDAEFAQLIPGQSKMIGKNGIAYIDDFEGAQTKIELKTFPAWNLCSPPNDTRSLTFENSSADGLMSGYNRAKLAWYVIDPVFYGNYAPGGIDNSSHEVRQIKLKEVFPDKDDDIAGFESRISVLNLAYYPNERGPYNFNPAAAASGLLPDPRSSWGGIMREIVMSDFESSNIEFIEFWVMDPFIEDPDNNGGKLYIHLGEISEDILKDNQKSFENGLPTSAEITNVDTSVWGRIPIGKSLVSGFAGGTEEREYQDIGLDGLNNQDEKSFFSDFADFDDPAADDFEYYLGSQHDGSEGDNITRRYKFYNGLENNSPAAGENSEYAEANKITPDIEDINDDNTLNTSETYYQYEIDISRTGLGEIGSNYIIDKREGRENGDNVKAMWYQFRIPLDDFESKVGDIEDFKSIRFMRIMLTDFDSPIVLRFATLDLIRGEWRRYKQDAFQSAPTTSNTFDNTSFEVSSVNIEENGSKSPVNYVLPPDITRVQDPNQPQVKQLNEQSLMVKVYDLEDNDARAVFKTTQLDLRQYQYLKMFLHAEQLPDGLNTNLDDYDLTAFIRIGSDYQNNYYEYEVPLKLSEPGTYNGQDTEDRKIVWPDANRIELVLQDLVNLKIERNEAMDNDPTGLINSQTLYTKNDEKYGDEIGVYNKLKVKGNPNLSNIRQIMIGVRNPGDDESLTTNDGEPKSGEIWFNELRLTDFNNEGGWAATGQLQAKLADLGIISFAGATSKPGFGSIEQKVEERQKEEINQIDVSSNLELGKFFPEKAQVSVPLFVGYSNTTINPEYYPKDPDIKLKDALRMAKSDEERQKIKDNSRDLTERKSINLTNVRWNKQFKKAKFLSPGNLSATVTYSVTEMKDYSIEYNRIRKYGANLNYVFNNRPKPVTPFSKWKAVRKPAFKIIRDINFNYQPSAFTFSTKFDRNYQTMKFRNVLEDEGIDLLIKPTTSKGLYWDRNYSLRWDFTKSLKFDYKASNRAIIDEPTEGDYSSSDWFEPDNQHWKDSVWANIMQGGRNLQFNQNFGLEYTLPLNKIPILNWTNIRTSYDATLNWTRGPRLTDENLNTPGNTLKNSNTITLNGNFNLKNLYNKVNYFKSLTSSRGKQTKEEDKRYKTVEFTRKTFISKDKPKNITHKLGTEKVTVKVVDKEGNEVEVGSSVVNENRITIESDKDITGATVTVSGQIERGENPLVFIADNSARMLIGLKNLNVTYKLTSSTMLPGYMPETDLFGFNLDEFYGAPGYPFVLGWQDTDIGHKARDNNWLTQYEYFNQANIYAVNEDLNFRATYEPFKGLRIDITGMRNHSKTMEENYYPYLDSIGPQYEGGRFSISVITLGTAFEEFSADNGWKSKAYDKFLSNRPVISRRLIGKKRESNPEYISSVTQKSEPGYADGYGSTSSEVLMYSFLAAYTDKDAEDIELNEFPWTIAPNWKVTFDGLSKIGFVQKFLKSLTLTHSYKSTYNMNGYGTNINYYETPTDFEGLRRDLQYNFIALYQPNSVAINEQLSPLISFDMTWHNSLLTKFEIARTRMISLSLNNNQITESRNKDFIVGAGYKFKDVPFKISTASSGSRTIKSDLNVRFDLSVRDNITILRSISTDADDQVTTGSRKITADLTADYVLSQKVNVQFYIRRDLNDPYVSTYYRNSETEFGFNLRLSL